MDSGYRLAIHSRGNLSGQQTHEKILNLTSYRETHIRTVMRYHFPPIRPANLKRLTMPKAHKDVGKLEPMCMAGGSII